MLDGRGAQILKVGDLLKENLLIPDYQRPYKWTRRNVSDLLSDISVVVSSEKIRQYRVGTVILGTKGSELTDTVLVIQQLMPAHTPDAASSDVRDRFGR